jgi:hypothetical protein
MSSFPAERVSIVVASNAPAGRLESCLAALAPQLDDAVEVVVHEAVESPADLRSRFPWARFTTSPGALVPELWRDGFRETSGDVVAFTIAQMIPEPDWVASMRRLLAEHEAVGGAIDPGPGLRLTDWGEYFCRYARDMRPFPAHDDVDLPGDNVAFSRRRLEEIAPHLETGYWEPVAHPELRRNGVVLHQSPELAVRMGRSAGFGAFVAQRLEHGRRYGHQRGVHFSRARNLLGVAGSPAVVALTTLRVLRRVFEKGRYRRQLLLALPAILAYNVTWAYAEARGHLDMLRRR